MTMIFHARVKTEQLYDSDREAYRLADTSIESIKRAGGDLSVGPAFGDDYAFLVLTLPEDCPVKPEDLVPGLEFTAFRGMVVPAVEDHGFNEVLEAGN